VLPRDTTAAPRGPKASSHGLGLPNLSQCSCSQKTSLPGALQWKIRETLQKAKKSEENPVTPSLTFALHPSDADASALPGMEPCLKHCRPPLPKDPPLPARSRLSPRLAGGSDVTPRGAPSSPPPPPCPCPSPHLVAGPGFRFSMG